MTGDDRRAPAKPGGLRRALAVLRSPVVRWLFLLGAVAAAVLVGCVSRTVVAAVALPVAGAGDLGGWGWLTWLAPLLLVGGYALAWVAGFVVVLVPAGAGVREVVLAALLGGSLAQPSVVLLVLLARLVLTVVDLLFAAAGLMVRRAPQR